MRFDVIADAVDQIAQFYAEYGKDWEIQTYRDLAARLRSGDEAALKLLFAEIRGAMGWGLGDRYFCPENSDSINENQVIEVNRRFWVLLSELKPKLEACAKEFGVRLE